MKPEAFPGPWRSLFHSQFVGNPAFGYYWRERNMLFTPAMILDRHECAVSISGFWFVKKKKQQITSRCFPEEQKRNSSLNIGWKRRMRRNVYVVFAAVLRRCPKQSMQQSHTITCATYFPVTSSLLSSSSNHYRQITHESPSGDL